MTSGGRCSASRSTCPSIAARARTSTTRRHRRRANRASVCKRAVRFDSGRCTGVNTSESLCDSLPASPACRRRSESFRSPAFRLDFMCSDTLDRILRAFTLPERRGAVCFCSWRATEEGGQPRDGPPAPQPTLRETDPRSPLGAVWMQAVEQSLASRRTHRAGSRPGIADVRHHFAAVSASTESEDLVPRRSECMRARQARMSSRRTATRGFFFFFTQTRKLSHPHDLGTTDQLETDSRIMHNQFLPRCSSPF